MIRSLATVMAIGAALATVVPPTALAQQAPAASPWPDPPQQSAFPTPSQQNVFPNAPTGPSAPSGPPQQASPFGPPQQAGGPGPGMPPVCAEFPKLRDAAEKKVAVVQQIGTHKPPDRAKMCAAVTQFAAAEAIVVKFLETNKTTCHVPPEALTNAKAVHVNTEKFKDQVCAEGPKPKIPTLSDAINTAPVDTPKNTRTGPGTFNTLTGNPLGN